MSHDRGDQRPNPSIHAVFQRRRFLTQLTAVAASASGLSACGGGNDGVEVTVGEGGLSFSDNTLFVTVGVQATVTIDDELYERALQVADPTMDKADLFREADDLDLEVRVLEADRERLHRAARKPRHQAHGGR